MQNNISTATAYNWERLGVIDRSTRLTSRANKRFSKKVILPIEYITITDNVDFIKNILCYITEEHIDHLTAIYSIAKKLLKQEGILFRTHVESVLSEYQIHQDSYLFNLDYPKNERDLLGAVYQGLLLEGKKNQIGSYYTPEKVVKNMTACILLGDDETFLDPCCGSGSFLLSVNAKPEQLYGIDTDPIAVFICKINLLLKYQSCSFEPQIYCFDYLDKNQIIPYELKDRKFNYIVTNPPWGANCIHEEIKEIESKESFSYFFVKAFKDLKENGTIRFLLPEAVLNVKVHKDIRYFMLSNGNIESITLYDGMFSGVTTHYVDIEMSKKSGNNLINVYTSERLFTVDRNNFYSTENLNFNFQSNLDAKIIEKVKSVGVYNLQSSIWALGVVTGDNKSKLLSNATMESEPIYTGKEILPYKLKSPTKYIVYDRKQMQQVAKEEHYRADEKLVYKFISNKLVFAYDNSKALFLNSANILIPKINNMSIKTVMAFLNSEVFQYLYNTLFAEIKILKGNLMELPFPSISKEQDTLISQYVQKILDGQDDFIQVVQKEIYKIFNLNLEEEQYIQQKLAK